MIKPWPHTFLGDNILISVQIQFYGNVTKSQEGSGKTIAHWEGGEHVTAIAYDVPIPGYATPSTNNLRLWSSKAASGEFDFQKFNSGEVLLNENSQFRALRHANFAMLV